MKSVMPELITVEELAFALKKTVKSIRSDATRNPKCLPPRCRLPGNKRLLWRREDVKDWIDKSVESKTENDDIAKEINRFQRKRGRPLKPKPREYSLGYSDKFPFNKHICCTLLHD